MCLPHLLLFGLPVVLEAVMTSSSAPSSLDPDSSSGGSSFSFLALRVNRADSVVSLVASLL